jgi:hypothetical protein
VGAGRAPGWYGTGREQAAYTVRGAWITPGSAPRGATEVRAIRVDLAPGEEAAAAGRVLSVGGRAATCNSDTDRDTTVADGMPEVTETGARVPAVSTRVEGTDLLVDVEWPAVVQDTIRPLAPR